MTTSSVGGYRGCLMKLGLFKSNPIDSYSLESTKNEKQKDSLALNVESNLKIINQYQETAHPFVSTDKEARDWRYRTFKKNPEHKVEQKRIDLKANATGAVVFSGCVTASTLGGAGLGAVAGIPGGPIGIGIGAGAGAAMGFVGGCAGGAIAGNAAASKLKRHWTTHSSAYRQWKESNAGKAMEEAFKAFIQSDTILGDPQRELLDSISYEIFWDPVKGPDGKTYERSSIIPHIQRCEKENPDELISPFKIEYLQQVQEIELPYGVDPIENSPDEILFNEASLRPDHRKRAQVLARVSEILTQHCFVALLQEEAIDPSIPAGPEIEFDAKNFPGGITALKNIAAGLNALKEDLLKRHDEHKQAWIAEVNKQFFADENPVKEAPLKMHEERARIAEVIEQFFTRNPDAAELGVLLTAIKDTFRVSYDDTDGDLL